MAQPARKLRSLREMAKGGKTPTPPPNTERKHSLLAMARGRC